jgi:predicted nuclease of predicted toxin-antitoxin system
VRLLIDQPISWHIAAELKSLGHDVLHVRDVGLAKGSDAAILELAAREQRVIVTQDTDFGTLLMAAGRKEPSVILFRMRDGRPASQVALLRQHLHDLESSLLQGAIVVFDDAHIRIRLLA